MLKYIFCLEMITAVLLMPVTAELERWGFGPTYYCYGYPCCFMIIRSVGQEETFTSKYLIQGGVPYSNEGIFLWEHYNLLIQDNKKQRKEYADNICPCIHIAFDCLPELHNRNNFKKETWEYYYNAFCDYIHLSPSRAYGCVIDLANFRITERFDDSYKLIQMPLVYIILIDILYALALLLPLIYIMFTKISRFWNLFFWFIQVIILWRLSFLAVFLVTGVNQQQWFFITIRLLNQIALLVFIIWVLGLLFRLSKKGYITIRNRFQRPAEA